jgi:hypothetical protein
MATWRIHTSERRGKHRCQILRNNGSVATGNGATRAEAVASAVSQIRDWFRQWRGI